MFQCSPQERESSNLKIRSARLSPNLFMMLKRIICFRLEKRGPFYIGVGEKADIGTDLTRLMKIRLRIISLI